MKRVALTLVVTGLCTAYILWKIDLGKTGARARDGARRLVARCRSRSWPARSCRWRGAGSGCSRRAACTTRCRGSCARTSSATRRARCCRPSLGGDASRIYETVRRHEGSGGAAAGTVLLERALGGVATLVLAAAGFALAVGRYDVGGYLWVELAFVVGVGRAAASCSSRRGCIRCCSARGRCCGGCGSTAAARGLSRGALVPARPGSARRDVRADARRAGGARARDLVRGQGGRVDLSPRLVMGRCSSS